MHYEARTSNKSINCMEKAGIIEPVQSSDWAAPIVPVVENNKTIHSCGDYKVTINQAAKVETYHLP